MAKRKVRKKAKRQKKASKEERYLGLLIILTILAILAIAYYLWTATETRYFFEEGCSVVQVPYLEKVCNSTGCYNETVNVNETVCNRVINSTTVYKYH